MSALALEVIRESFVLTTALSLGAAVSKAIATVRNAHFVIIIFIIEQPYLN